MAVIWIIRGIPSSNKHKEKKGNLKISDIAYSFPYGGGTAYVLNPVIDKVSFTFDIDHQDKEGMSGGLWELALSENSPQHEKASPSVYKKAKYEYSVRYKRAVSLVEPASQHRIEIYCDPASETAKFFRFEFNPSVLGKAGLKFLRIALNELLAPHYCYQNIWESGRVTRFDVATDIINIDPDDVIIESALGGKSVLYQSRKHALETVYLHEKELTKAGKLKPSNLYIYSKSAKHLTSHDDNELEYGGVPQSRVEVRRRPNCLLKNLHKQVVPFSDVNLKAPLRLIPDELSKLGEGDHHWGWFLDSTRQTGLSNALDKIQTGKLKEAYSDALQASIIDVWKPDSLGELWNETVMNSGLYDIDDTD